jgi:hypothetical protein
MLRAKMLNCMSASESGRMQHNLNKKVVSKRPHTRNRSGPSSCTLGTVAEHEAFLSGEPDTEPIKKPLEFWLDLFLNAHAFRVGGPSDSLIWDPEEVTTEGGEKKKHHYRTFSYRIDDKVSSSECDSASAWQTGEAGIGEIIEVKGVEAWRTVFVSGFMGGMRTSGSLAPLRLSTRDNMFRPMLAECNQVVIQRVGSTSDDALAVIDGRIQLLPGRQGWEHEQLYRHWSVTKNENGYRFRFAGCGGGELAAEGTTLVLKETGMDWKLNPVTGADGLAVHLMSGKSSIVPLPGGHVEFSSRGTRNHSWHIYQQSHGSQKPALSVFRSYQLEPGKGVFHAAKVWRKNRNPGFVRG